MNEFIAKLKQARESWATVEGVDLLIRRPTATDESAMMLSAAESSDRSAEAVFRLMERRIRLSVIGWRGVKECDLIGAAGGALEVPFDIDLFVEWAKDRQAFMIAVHDACKRVVDEHNEKKAQTEKN